MFRKFREQGFTLVELMIVVAIIGILAALAIPAFIAYLNRAKASEAEGMISTMQDGAQSYYEGDQRWSTTDGAESWHVDSDEIPGTAVGFNSKTFPGGDSASLSTHTNVPADGGQGEPDIDLSENATAQALNLQIDEHTYFAYEYRTHSETGSEAAAGFAACHNFTGDGNDTCDVTGYDADPPAPTSEGDIHTILAACNVEDRGARCYPTFTEHEFQ